MHFFRKHISIAKARAFTMRALAMLLCVFISAFLVSCKPKTAEASESQISASFTSAQNVTDISVSARSAIAIECQNGEIYFEKNAHERMPMASTTKIMTALVAIEKCDISREISVSPSAVGIEGSSVYLYANERITVEDLLYALLLSSANDAAVAIAIEVGGSIEGFSAMMNEKAADIGLKDTHFDNPHGLDSQQHYTTAYDLAMITMEAMKDPTFAKIVSTKRKTIPLDSTNGVRLLINHNKLLNSYDGVVGVKTGFTKKSGRCLVSAADIDGVNLICVTLNAPNDWSDHKAMLDLGRSIYEHKVVFDTGEFAYFQNVCGADVSSISVTNELPLSYTSRKDMEKVTCHIELMPFSFAPIKRGDILGRIYYKQGEHILSESPLVAAIDVQAQKKPSFFDRIKELI